jgi:c-di-GMP phosphodiesterase
LFGLFKKTPEKIEQSSTDIYLARQPIFDSNRQVHAYELLYRSGKVGGANVFDADKATSTVIANAFLNIGIEEISNGKPVFINLPRKFITGEIPLELDPELVVLEVLEDISADKLALKGIQELVKRGYTVALDDFILGPNNEAFLPFASYIKVDVLGISDEELRRQTEQLLPSGIPLLAEKVEDEARFQLCAELGYQYFQGYFFSKPTLVEGKELSSNQLALLNILAKLQNPDCQVEDLERIVATDVGLSFKLLKIINSSYYNVGKTVESIQQALILMGLSSLRKWVTLITLSSTQTKASELMVMALLRAKHCENLAGKFKVKGDAAFTVGMFSLLDAIMDQPLSVLVKQLPLSPEVKEALLSGTGELGALLLAVAHYEHGNFDCIEARFMRNSLINDCYKDALKWCDAIRADLGV